MTTPTPVPGPDGIRGPNRNSLGDLFDQLSAIAGGLASLPAIAADIAAIRAGVETIVGVAVPEEWAGLPWFLDRAIGRTATELQNPGVSIFANTQGIATNAQRIATYLTAGSIAGPNTPYLATVVQALAGNTTGLPGGVNTLQQQLAALNSLALVAGTLAESPSGETLKSLLRDLLACCEDGGGGGPGTQPENPVPSSACTGYAFGPFRATEYLDADSPVDFGSGTADSYCVGFGPLATATGGNIEADVDTGAGFVSFAYHPTAGSTPMCLSWDLTGNNVPQNVSIVRFGTGPWYSGGTTGTTISPFVTPVGSYTFTVSDEVRFMVLVDMAPGVAPPALNFHLSVDSPAS